MLIIIAKMHINNAHEFCIDFILKRIVETLIIISQRCVALFKLKLFDCTLNKQQYLSGGKVSPFK